MNGMKLRKQALRSAGGLWMISGICIGLAFTVSKWWLLGVLITFPLAEMIFAKAAQNLIDYAIVNYLTGEDS